jgi:hypothetical protein
MTKKHKDAAKKALIMITIIGLALLPNTLPAAADDGNAARTVHGYVWPMATQGLAPGFLEMHAVTAELRETFQTPARAGLSATAVLTDGSGKGEFTIENVPYGDYVLVIQRPGYLARCMNVTISGAGPGAVELAPPDDGAGVFNLLYGDINGDLVIDDEDLAALMGNWNAGVNSPGYDPACDLDANGRVDNSDALLLMEHYGSYAGDYPGAWDVDFLAGQSIVGSTVKLALYEGCEYRVPITAKNIGAFAGMAVTYDPSALKLKTAAEQVFGQFTSAGGIPGTGITIASASPGIIKLAFDTAAPQGAAWTGIVTVLKFEALRNGATTVSIE